MAGDTSSNIFINIDTSQAMAQLRALEKEITALNRALIVGTKTAAQAQSKYAQGLLHNVNATGKWTASMGTMQTATEQFARSLDRSKLSLKEYFRYGMASTKTFGRVFGNEFDTVGKLVEKRVKVLQQQYVQLGRDAQGAMNALKFTPKALNYRDVTTQLMLATQRQQIFNKLMDDGSTKLLNFGKNTQWAGRQLMVGFTIPLMLFGSQAIRTFKEIETQTIRFKKVYGDIFTDQGATDQALKNIRELSNEYTKFGLKVADTIGMAADAAAAGFSGKALENIVEQTNKLAVLGGVTQEKALETTIALQNAFQINTGDLSKTIDFLNAVENQTVVALEDLTEAIPRVAPVVKQLGGDVKDLAYFMAAMQEGGISAAQGANALKSGLASLINPSKKATAAAAELGINLKAIVEENAGNLRATVSTFAEALRPLTDLQKQRIIEQIFGKYQFSRISALMTNLTREGTQAARVLQLANASVEELAILTQRELKVQADSPMNKLASSVEKLKAAIAPIGKVFAEVLTPVINWFGKMAEKFNNLPEGMKKAIAIMLGVVAGIGPVFLMTFGLVANALANSLKGVNLLRKGYQQLAYGSSDAALKTQYLSNEELENISVTNSLYSSHDRLSAAYKIESAALAALIAQYTSGTAAMRNFSMANPGLFIPGKAVPPVRRAGGGTVKGPGTATSDSIPAYLSDGEYVINAKAVDEYGVDTFDALNARKYASGGPVIGKDGIPRLALGGWMTRIIQSMLPRTRMGVVQEGVSGYALSGFGGGSRAAARVSAVAPSPNSTTSWRKIPWEEDVNGFTIRDPNTDEIYKIRKVNKQEFDSKFESLVARGSIPKNKDRPEMSPADYLLHRLYKYKKIKKEALTPSNIFKNVGPEAKKRNKQAPSPVKKALERAAKKDPTSNAARIVKALEKDADFLQTTNKLTAEEKAIIKGNLSIDVSHIDPKDSLLWSPRTGSRDLGVINKVIAYERKKYKLNGSHIFTTSEAEGFLQHLRSKEATEGKLSPTHKAAMILLEKRIKDKFYDKYKLKDLDIGLSYQSYRTDRETGRTYRVDEYAMGGMVQKFGVGTAFVGMPKSFAKVQKSRVLAQQIDARVTSSRFRDMAPTNFGTLVKETSGHSFPIPGVGGVYRKPDGSMVFVKPVMDEKAALAEQRATLIARKAHGLKAPKQSIKTMIDPTDPLRRRKFIVLESPYDENMAKGGTDFTKEQYFKQLVASTLRGDKDLSPDNVFGDVLADVGTAGVFGRASGKRDFKFNMPSMAEQALVNLLGVKGGAKKAFAENTANMIKKMTPAEYQKAMEKEIDFVLPRLKKTVESFKLDRMEKVLYERMIERLQAGRKVNWREYHAIHSQVKPKKYAQGVFSVPGPKGAGDVVPAMLSPGEAVIPTAESEKYRPLIRSIIADNVPGYAKSNIPRGGSTTIPFSDTEALEQNTKAITGNTDVTEGSTKTTKQDLKEKRKLARTRGVTGWMLGYGKIPNVDPESGRQLSYAEKRNYRQQQLMSGGRMATAMGVGGVASVAMMYGMAKPESAVGQNMNLLMGVTALATVLPMLNSPLKMLIASVVGLVALYKMQSAQIKQALIDGEAQAKASAMTTNKLELLGSFTNQVSLTQQAAERRAARTTEMTPVNQTFGYDFLKSDTGKQFMQDFNKNVETFGPDKAGTNLANQLASAVQQGVLTTEQADSIATNIARSLRSTTLEANVRGRLVELLGPNGVNLNKNPYELNVKLMADARELERAGLNKLDRVSGKQLGITWNDGEKNINPLKWSEGTQLATTMGAGTAASAISGVRTAARVEDAVAAGKAGGVLGKAVTALKAGRLARTAILAGSAATGPGVVAGIMQFAIGEILTIGATVALRQWQKGNEKKAIAKIAGQVAGTVSQNLSLSQQGIDAMTAEYDSAIKNLEARKKLVKTAKERAKLEDSIKDMEQKKSDATNKAQKQQADIVDDAAKYIDKIESQEAKNKYADAYKVQMEKKFKDDPYLKERAKQLNQTMSDKKLSQKSTIQIQALVNSDQLTLEQAEALVQSLTGKNKDFQARLNLIIDKTSLDGLARFAEISKELTSKQKKQFENIVNQKLIRGQTKDVDSLYTALEGMIRLPDFVGIDVNAEVQPNDILLMEKLGRESNALKDQFEGKPITLEALTDYKQQLNGEGTTNSTLDNAIKNWELLSSLDPNVRLSAMMTLQTLNISDSIGAQVSAEQKNAFLKTKKGKSLKAFANSGQGYQADLFEKELTAYKNSKEGQKVAQDYIDGIAKRLFPPKTPTPKVPGVVGGAGDGVGQGALSSWMESLGQRAKLFSESRFDPFKTMEEVKKYYVGRKFGSEGAGFHTVNESKNPLLDKQAGAIRLIKEEAKEAGISLSTELLDAIENFSPDEFNKFADDFLKLGKGGKVIGLKQDFKTLNEFITDLGAAGFIDKIDKENRAREQQIKAYRELSTVAKDVNGTKFTALEIEAILSDEVLAARIAEQGYNSLSIDEREKINAGLQKSIDLKLQDKGISLGDEVTSLQNQITAYDKLNALGIKHEVILQMIQDRLVVNAVLQGKNLDDIISKTESIIALTDKLAQKQKSQADLLQEQIDENLAALELQARELQNAFDIKTFQLKIDIANARDVVNKINDKIQAEQDKIDAINLKIKFDPVYGDYALEDLREKISDAQRAVEEQFDRPIAELQDRSGILSNDLALMDKAAEAINEKYDKQEEALNKISQINQDIINQQKSQIGLADALTQGDISAAAKLAQDMRGQAADAASRTAGDVLAASRKSEIENLRSASGMTRRQIEEEQFKISQRIFNLEQQRKVNQAEILKLEDDLYNRQELREQATLAIRKHELEIERIRKDELIDAEKRLKALEDRLELEENLLKKELDAIEKRKLEWEKAQIALDKYKQTLKKTTAAVLSMDDALKKVSDAVQVLNLSAKVAIDSGFLSPDDEKQLDQLQKDRNALIAEYDKLMAEYNAMPGGSDANIDKKKQFLETINARFPQGRPEVFKRPTSLTAGKKPLIEMFKDLNKEIEFFEEQMEYIRDYFDEIREDVEEIVENWDLIREDAETILSTIQQLSTLFVTVGPQIEAFKDSIAGLEIPLENIATDTERTDVAFTNITLQGAAFATSITTIEGAVSTLATQLEAAYKAVSAITKEIQSWDTTVTTRHVIEVEYQYLNKGPNEGSKGVPGIAPGSEGVPGIAPGSMYGGKIKNFNFGGKVSYFNNGDMVAYKPIGSDTVPAMLTPGEFIVNKAAAKEFYPLLSAINNSNFPSLLANNNNFGQNVKGLAKGQGGIGNIVSDLAKNMIQGNMAQRPISSTSFVEPQYTAVSPVNVSNTSIDSAPVTNNNSNVYNYNVGVNVAGTSVDPQTIAKAVIDEIRYADSQRIRGIRP